MAANSQQFGTNRIDHAPKKNNEVNVSYLEQQLIELTSLVRQMTVGNGQTVKACGVCVAVRTYDPYSNTYNPGWKDHPNLRYVNPQANQPGPHAQPHNQAYRTPYPQQHQRHQIKTPASIQNLNNQMGQLAIAINKLEAQHSNALPSQKIPNPRENASAITLRNGKELKVKEKEVDASSKEELNEEPKVDDKEETREEAPKDILLLDAIKQRKQTLKGCQKVELGENVSAVIQRKLPAKCKDPDMFSISCNIENVRLEKAILDLGALINVMPDSIYASLKLGPLNKTGIVIQLADRSNAYPRGIVEDLLVQVNNLVFPADFYVLDMENGDHNSPIDEDDEICFNGEMKEMVNTLNSAPALPQSGNLAYLSLPISNTRCLPSVLQAPVVELKTLSKHFKYVFLGEGETLPVIIFNSLKAEQEEQLVKVLKEHKTAIGWTIADIKGISPSTCMHRILMEEG
ncbi:uncharacterized protein [Henckelia pumila]|uniref:uncharacterized protein n=1 Tax=Henckelia pumila TaxID=405737 RepID=UPI003C6E99C0